jgi:predicted dehydrogenase
MDESAKEYVSGWLLKKDTLGGAVLFSASRHMLDIMLWICGDVQVAYMAGTRGGVLMEGEDTAARILKFKNGVVGVTRHTWVSPRSRIWCTMHALCEKAHVTLTTTPLGDLVKEGHLCKCSTRITALGAKEEVLLESSEGLDLAPEIEHFFQCDSGRRPDGRR